eukprot:TRINITY_DN575_c0_g1_i1.p1 TRINITY_DN575_c0_g1~~TRINITY_DN575_c0_g1_i1.p1  ORF type:complete len:243 (-),score=33.85 TRINITY_DN575_c0_g1_i1:100-828(-)
MFQHAAVIIFFLCGGVFAGIYNNCTTGRSYSPNDICLPTYPTFNSSLLKDSGYSYVYFYNDLIAYFRSLPQEQDSSAPLKDTYTCTKALTNLFCGKIFPRCNETDPTDNETVSAPCSSYCQDVINTCPANYTQIWKNSTDARFPFPSLADCFNTSLYSSDVAHCTNLTNSDTSLTLAYDETNSTVVTPTVAPTTAPKKKTTKRDITPKGGWLQGGFVGAAILFGVMLIMAGLMYIMKKQDQR